MLALAREAGERGGTYPVRLQRRERGRRRRVPRRPAPFLGIAEAVEETLAAVDGAPARDLDELVEADAEARRLTEPKAPSRMNVFIAILGLAFLILVHEAGHFFAALAVGMRPRKFYLGFPPAVVKTKRSGIEYGIGAIPLGGYVKIPGMHRPAPGGRRRALRPRRSRSGPSWPARCSG